MALPELGEEGRREASEVEHLGLALPDSSRTPQHERAEPLSRPEVEAPTPQLAKRTRVRVLLGGACE